MARAVRIIEQWPKAPRKAAEKILDHCGPPDEATRMELSWSRTEKSARMELTADKVVCNFPTPRTDYLTQNVDYPVPAEKTNELIAFVGSVILDRTAGQTGARCDREAYNTLALNLAVEIIEGKRSVDDARRLYGETAAAFVLGRSAPYVEGLLFTPLSGDTADPDESVVPASMAHQTVEKVKDGFGAGKPPAVAGREVVLLHTDHGPPWQRRRRSADNSRPRRGTDRSSRS